MTRKLVPLLLSASLALFVAACGGGDEVTVEGPNGEVNVGDEGITVEGPSGEVNIGTGDYPEGWPSDFPVPDGASPVYSLAAGGGVSVWFGTDQSADEIKSYYTDALPAAGYTIESQADFSDESGSYSVFSISGNGWSGGIYLGEGAGAAAPGFEGDFDFFVSLTPAA
jgi:hypothetical protein